MDPGHRPELPQTLDEIRRQLTDALGIASATTQTWELSEPEDDDFALT
jgi:hypothetical protein